MSEKFETEFWDYLDQLVENSELVIDRPKDASHPRYEDMIYPLDYGYLAGTTASDGAGIDVWVGENGENLPSAVICSVDLLKRDSEIKILLGCSDDEMRTIVDFVNQGDMRCLLIKR
jgi:inorganic pyrophosphatase